MRTIPGKKQLEEKCNFFLDTPLAELYTFVNCSIRVAGSMSHRKGRIETMATKKAAKKPAKKAAKKAAKKK
jgi:hypothetical protein